MAAARFTKCPGWVLTKTKPIYFLSPCGEGFVQPKISAVQSAYNTEKLTMTNTQNVTELQPRMTREQLIDAARKAATLLPAAYGWMVNELATRLDVTSVALCEAMEQRKSLALENNYLLDLAASELSTSWLHARAMLGMQAAELCISQGDIKAAHEWLQGTTDEAVAEMPENMNPAGLQAWFDSYMVSNDGKNGFLTREEATEKLRMRIPSTTSILDEVRASAIPDGWKLVPEQMHIDATDIESICDCCGNGDELYGEFTDGILWVGELSNDGVIKYGLNVASAEYPDEGSITIYEFSPINNGVKTDGC